MKNKKIKRFYIQQLITDCENIVTYHLISDNKDVITLSDSEKQSFFELGITLKYMLSIYSNPVSSKSLAEDYLNVTWITMSRLFFEKKTRRFHKKNIMEILKSCKRVADEYLGDAETTLAIQY